MHKYSYEYAVAPQFSLTHATVLWMRGDSGGNLCCKPSTGSEYELVSTKKNMGGTSEKKLEKKND